MTGKKLEERRREFKELVDPVIKYINDNHNPHTRVVIDCDSAEVLNGIYKVVTDEFILD